MKCHLAITGGRNWRNVFLVELSVGNVMETVEAVRSTSLDLPRRLAKPVIYQRKWRPRRPKYASIQQKVSHSVPRY